MSAIPDSTLADCKQLVADLQRQLAECRAERDQAIEYQTATSDVLQVISRSTFDLQRVLETLAESAATLAQSDTVFIFRREWAAVRLVAQYAPTPAFAATIGSLTLGADRKSTTGRALLIGDVVRITNVQDEPDYQLPQSEEDRIGSAMAVPLLRDGETIGVITLARLRVEPYTDRHVELVRTFADQAVIAIDNARLLTELRESLEQQTATAEVLGVINSSPGDLFPVWDAMLEKAASMCEANLGFLCSYDGEAQVLLASRGRRPNWWRLPGGCQSSQRAQWAASRAARTNSFILRTLRMMRFTDPGCPRDACSSKRPARGRRCGSRCARMMH